MNSTLGSLGSKIQVYADDVLLYKTITSPSDFTDFQRSIDCISTWSQDNFLSLNHKKCKFMLITQKVHQTPCINPLQLDGIALERVMSYIYLGVIFTSDLSWSKDIESMYESQKNCGTDLSSLLPSFFHEYSTLSIFICMPDQTTYCGHLGS